MAKRSTGSTDCARYKIVRHYFDGSRGRRTVQRGLTLAEAQKHCRSPESSSKSAVSSAGRARTRKYGPWFDGYDHDVGSSR